MGKKNQQSRDQKRKAKLAERARRSGQTSSLAYTGTKYKRDELVRVFYRTEVGIYESFVVTQRTLTDRMVAGAATKLVLQLRQGPLSPLDNVEGVDHIAGQEDDLVIWNIRRNWQHLFQTEPHPGSKNLQGVLRTILGSISTWSTPGAQSQGYMHYLEGFLKRMGVSVELCSADRKPISPPPEDELLAIGRAWCGGDSRAAAEFQKLAEYLTRSGQAERVAEACQHVIGEAGGLR